MTDCFYLWKLLFIVSSCGVALLTNGVPSSNKPSVLEVPAGQTAKIQCPSNDDDHRFQFWQLKGNQILGPQNKINARKYKYEVLSGTLFIKAVSQEEHGIYTCVCKYLFNATYTSKSVMLVVKSDWNDVWENDEVNFFRLSTILVVITVLCVVIYVIRNNIRRDRLMRFRDLTNESVDEVPSRKVSHNGRSMEMREGIDNPALDIGLNFSRESTPTFEYARSSKY